VIIKVKPINVVSDFMVLNVKNKFISVTNSHFSAKVCAILLHICSNIHITKSALIIPVKRFVLQIWNTKSVHKICEVIFICNINDSMLRHMKVCNSAFTKAHSASWHKLVVFCFDVCTTANSELCHDTTSLEGLKLLN